MGLDNLFLAIFPDEAAAARITRLARRLRRAHDLQGAIIAPDRLHVSVYGFGRFADLPESVVKAAIEIGSKVRSAPFDAVFDQAMSFDGKGDNAFVLLGNEGVSGLASFHRLVRRTVAEARASRPASRSYTPHVTMLYDEKIVDEHPVEPIAWTVRDFALVRSLVGRGAYKVLARWRLQD